MFIPTTLRLVRIVDFLIQSPARNKEVEGLLEGLLGVMEEGVEAVPASGPQGTGGVDEARKGHRHDLIGRIDKGHLVHIVGVRIVQGIITLDAAAETSDTAQIGLHIRAPLGLGPARPAQLKTDSGVGGKGRGAACGRGIQLVTACVRADTIVVDLVEIIVAVARGRLLFDRAAHWNSVLWIDYCKGQ